MPSSCSTAPARASCPRPWVVESVGVTSRRPQEGGTLCATVPPPRPRCGRDSGTRPDDEGLRASIRAMRAADGLLLGVLDDDPTGSQAVHGVQVVTVLEEEAYQAGRCAGPAATCFVLTDARGLEKQAATEMNVLAARGLVSVAGRRVRGCSWSAGATRRCAGT